MIKFMEFTVHLLQYKDFIPGGEVLIASEIVKPGFVVRMPLEPFNVIVSPSRYVNKV